MTIKFIDTCIEYMLDKNIPPFAAGILFGISYFLIVRSIGIFISIWLELLIDAYVIVQSLYTLFSHKDR